MKIIIVEDDHHHRAWLKDVLFEHYGKEDVVEEFETEDRFYSNLDKIEADPPDLFLIDVMLRWTDPKPNMPDPPGKFFRAGVRCIDRLLAIEATSKVPILLYTILEEIDLDNDIEKFQEHPHIQHLQKTNAKEDIITAVEDMLQKNN